MQNARELATTHALDAEPYEHGAKRDEGTADDGNGQHHRGRVADILGMNKSVDHRSAAQNAGAKSRRHEKEQAYDHQAAVPPRWFGFVDDQVGTRDFSAIYIQSFTVEEVTCQRDDLPSTVTK